MCGIVGYLGKKSVVPLIIDSLRTLEYRGYDSAGIAYLNDEQLFEVYKAAGKLVNLENTIPRSAYDENGSQRHIGIGHIRWATHGAANNINAHPHVGGESRIALVHNGIIENFSELKTELQAKGRTFLSDTDTECVVQLLEQLATEMPCDTPAQFEAVLCTALKKLRGAYALSIIHRSFPSHLFAVRSHAPLVVGETTNEQGETEYMVASDAVAIVPHTNRILYLKDNEVVTISPEGLRLTNLAGQPLVPHIEEVNLGPLQIDKKGFKHFMLKEIHEQPDVVRNSLSGRLVGTEQPIRLIPTEADDSPLLQQVEAILKTVDRLVVVGCGTSFNAGLVGKYFIEDLVRIPVEVEAAGEYRYRNPVITPNTLLVAISQSGETADTLEAIRQSASLGAKVLCITNREDSTLAREADIVLPVRAGVEVSVCATKSFIAQIVVLYLLGLSMAELRGSSNNARIHAIKEALLRVPAQIDSILADTDAVQAIAKQYSHTSNMFFIARGINYPVALEGALKLKEISYIHAEGYSGSELKHGPIAMLDEAMPVVSVLTPGVVFEKMMSNCQEAKARDARMIGFTCVPLSGSQAETFESVCTMPACDEELVSPLVTTIPLQLLAYFMAEHLGKDVDQPRNLAKSVTVE